MQIQVLKAEITQSDFTFANPPNAGAVTEEVMLNQLIESLSASASSAKTSPWRSGVKQSQLDQAIKSLKVSKKFDALPAKEFVVTVKELDATGTVEDLYIAPLEVSAIEIHCANAEGATAKLSHVNTVSAGAGFELSIGIATLGAKGSVKVTLKESYTAKNECVEYVISLPAFWQRVLMQNEPHEEYYEIRLLEVIEGETNIEVRPLRDCSCRRDLSVEDLGLNVGQYKVIDLSEVKGVRDDSEELEISGEVSVGFKIPFGPVDSSGTDKKLPYSVAPKVTLSGLKQLGFAYTLPGGQKYARIRGNLQRSLTWADVP